jgi:acyl-CoA reductase-like NAD-dependent aldehyde dehydrogenase
MPCAYRCSLWSKRKAFFSLNFVLLVGLFFIIVFSSGCTLIENSSMATAAILSDMYPALRQAFLSGKTKKYSWRLSQLKALKKMVTEHMSDIIEAIGKDLGRGTFESEGLECLPVVVEIDHAISNLKAWIKPIITSVPAMMEPATSEYVNDPLGVCLIIGPFNYPVNLLVSNSTFDQTFTMLMGYL